MGKINVVGRVGAQGRTYGQVISHVFGGSIFDENYNLGVYRECQYRIRVSSIRTINKTHLDVVKLLGVFRPRDSTIGNAIRSTASTCKT